MNLPPPPGAGTPSTGLPFTPTTPTRRSRVPLVIGVLVVAVLLVGGGVLLFAAGGGDDVDAAAMAAGLDAVIDETEDDGAPAPFIEFFVQEAPRDDYAEVLEDVVPVDDLDGPRDHRGGELYTFVVDENDDGVAPGASTDWLQTDERLLVSVGLRWEDATTEEADAAFDAVFEDLVEGLIDAGR